MLLIFLSRAASSLLAVLFGSLRFFSLGRSPARGWRWPIGACAGPWFLTAVDDPPPVCAMAVGTAIRIANAVVMMVARIAVLPCSEELSSRPVGDVNGHAVAPS